MNTDDLQALRATVDRLLAEKTEEDGDCLIWTGRASKKVGGQPKHGSLIMRRAVWAATRGPLEPGDLITVTCENSLCLCHLAKTNKSEISRKSQNRPQVRALKRIKSAAWARSNLAKLDMEKAREIRVSTEDDHTLAARYGVDHSLISAVRRNRAWVETMGSPFAGLGARHV